MANVDVICKALKEESQLQEVKELVILSDNAETYSAKVFHLAAFDVVASHGLILAGVVHNEAQDGKTELDSTFFHFKQRLKKHLYATKLAVLTPYYIATAMEYSPRLA